MSKNPPAHSTSHSEADLLALLALQQKARTRPDLVGTQNAKARKAKLDKIAAFLDKEENVRALVAALHQDFRKPEVETLSSELGVVLSQLKYIRKNLGKWMKPKRLPASMALFGIKSYLHLEPKGSALIIAPWNYPFNLTIIPLLYAIAAGCTAIVKPSEMSPATTAFIRAMLDELFDENEIKVVTGEGDTAAFLTTLPFDHIFFTGSPAVGKKVMAAAAKNLTSVTLELGGKSPAVIDVGVNEKKSAANSVWGKFFNAGQTCIAPDYLLVPESMQTSYVSELKGAIARFYGDDPQQSTSLARVITDNHFSRIKRLFDDAVSKGAIVACGGHFDASERYVSPTILTGVTEEMAVMQEEIFGPLWPVMTYRDLDEAVQIINRQPKALSFYIQTKNRKTIEKLKRETSSGGLLVNEYLLGGGAPNVPFGGVNNSGIGKSFGYHGFVEFSNERAVMERKFFDLSVGYPPYTDGVLKVMRRIYKWL
ncbi:aldehyde dehydrogenase family protein [Neolewinella antarctica]|uniref:Aldehyde dehydrogenase n=1 Tax=Neolewinella antarctica TaxID=442734 RepID=A0ABX0XF41_9BACT|nr:aldehyde dehydrogenase family protein [Neolewinella antarctica]NJC27938.1 aldehyde dehydrogenase (NAD+) [Neolewinella antarctica]